MLNTAKNRTRPTKFVELISPHGTLVEVREDRAESLLKRGAVTFGDGKFRVWTLASEATDGKPREVDAADANPAGEDADLKTRTASKQGSGKGA